MSPAGKSAQPRPARASGTASGFTLLELLAVLAVIALLTSVAGPSLNRWFAPKGIADDAGFIRASFIAAQQRAIATGARQTVEIKPTTLRFRGKEQSLPGKSAISINESPAERAVTFYPDGSATPVTLSLKKGAEVAEVSVNWLTGAKASR